MIKYCIFDLDGTLLNTIRSITYYLNNTLAEEGIAPITEEECKIFIGDGAKKLVCRALLSKGITSEELNERVLAKYNAAYDNDPYYLTEPYPGITELIDELRTRGYVLGVLSNKPDSTAVSVVKRFFGESFELIAGGREGVALKPAPDSTLNMLRDMGGTPETLAFIGDTAVDITTGKNAGAALTVGVLWGFRTREELEGAGADVIAESARDVLEAVKKI